jgi:hypothetical protein
MKSCLMDNSLKYLIMVLCLSYLCEYSLMISNLVLDLYLVLYFINENLKIDFNGFTSFVNFNYLNYYGFMLVIITIKQIATVNIEELKVKALSY